MTRIAISGHRDLGDATAHLIDVAIRNALADQAGVVIGVSCLADGADQIFARAVIDLGGAIEAVVPAEKYRDGFPVHAHATYDELLSAATAVHRMPFVESTSDSHMAASEFMLSRADQLYAVWGGKPPRGYGGTADVVAEAHRRGIPTRVIWPDGARRG